MKNLGSETHLPRKVRIHAKSGPVYPERRRKNNRIRIDNQNKASKGIDKRTEGTTNYALNKEG